MSLGAISLVQMRALPRRRPSDVRIARLWRCIKRRAELRGLLLRTPAAIRRLAPAIPRIALNPLRVPTPLLEEVVSRYRRWRG